MVRLPEISAAALMSSDTAVAIGTVFSSTGQGEGAVDLAFAAEAPLFTATERTLHVRAEAGATVTAGVLVPFIIYGSRT